MIGGFVLIGGRFFGVRQRYILRRARQGWDVLAPNGAVVGHGRDIDEANKVATEHASAEKHRHEIAGAVEAAAPVLHGDGDPASLGGHVQDPLAAAVQDDPGPEPGR